MLQIHPVRKYLCLSLLFALLSCNSPQARLERLQHAFWQKFARQDFFEIRLKTTVLHWPLPPASEPSDEQKKRVLALQEEARAIEKGKLSEAGQKQLVQLEAALKDCVSSGSGALFDPSRCVPADMLKQYSSDPDFPVLLEQIPVYYARIEERWHAPDARFVLKAVEESQRALDLLGELENGSGGKMAAQTAAARVAIKDFIGLCQSALLEQ